ncbi:MAG: hypothetical protein IT379_33070 [Deltaproteobacteria bacterium]|nr:hypothetical protein [Deltaproteobacteria bacterium]
MSKRKAAPLTIPRTPLDAPRAVRAASPTRAYPRAAELASSPAWADWLQSALRAVVLPAGVAGAMGLAACGIVGASDVEPDPSTSLEPCDRPTGSTLPSTDPVPLGGAAIPVQPTPTPNIAPHPEPLRMPGEAPPVLAQPPTPPVPPAPIPPPTNPPHIRGRVANTGTE